VTEDNLILAYSTTSMRNPLQTFQRKILTLLSGVYRCVLELKAAEDKGNIFLRNFGSGFPVTLCNVPEERFFSTDMVS